MPEKLSVIQVLVWLVFLLLLLTVVVVVVGGGGVVGVVAGDVIFVFVRT